MDSMLNRNKDAKSTDFDYSSAVMLVRNSIIQLQECIQTIEIGDLHNNIATGDLDRQLSTELQKVTKKDHEMSKVSEFIIATFMKQSLLPSVIEHPTADEKVFGELHSKMSRKCSSSKFKNVLQSLESLKIPGAENTKEIKTLLLSEVDSWGMDVFKLDTVSNNRPLTFLAYTLFEKYDFLKIYQIPSSTLVKYLMSVEDSYLDMPYHNHIHAADVTQCVYFLLQAPALQNIFTNIEIFAVLFSAVIHDVNHPGVTNKYLSNTNSELALIYNDESILEHYHLSVAFQLLQHADIFASIDKWQRLRLRRIINEIVLATDNAKHTMVLASLKVNVTALRDRPRDEIPQDKRIELLKALMHCADLGNATKPLILYQKWVKRIMEEFWDQGDKELEQGLPISPMCDRRTTNVSKAQMGFIDFVVKPIFLVWSDLVFPHVNTLINNLNSNRLFFATNDSDINWTKGLVGSKISDRSNFSKSSKPVQDKFVKTGYIQS